MKRFSSLDRVRQRAEMPEQLGGVASVDQGAAHARRKVASVRSGELANIGGRTLARRVLALSDSGRSERHPTGLLAALVGHP